MTRLDAPRATPPLTPKAQDRRVLTVRVVSRAETSCPAVTLLVSGTQCPHNTVACGVASAPLANCPASPFLAVRPAAGATVSVREYTTAPPPSRLETASTFVVYLAEAPRRATTCRVPPGLPEEALPASVLRWRRLIRETLFRMAASLETQWRSCSLHTGTPLGLRNVRARALPEPTPWTCRGTRRR